MNSIPDAPDHGSTGLPDEVWTPAAPSRAGRFPSMGQKNSSARAVLVGGAAPRHVYAESSVEERIAMVLLNDPNVTDLEEQISPVGYVDEGGVPREHWFDLRVTTVGGTRIAIAVKPWRKAVAIGLPKLLAHMAKQIAPSFAHGIRLMTDLDVPRDVVHDARLLHAVRRDPPSAADGALRAIVSELSGTTTVRDLVETSGLGAAAFRAAARLVASGHVRVVGGPRFDHGARIARGPAFERRAA